MLTPRVRLVSSRIRSLNRSTAFGAIRRFGVPALVKLNPRNFRSHGRATALFCWFTLSLSFARDESRKAFHHSFPCPPAANVDIAVVRIPREPETAPLQLPVELVEHDVRQQGRQRPALRRPFIHRTHQPVFHHSGLQKRPDQLQQPLVANPFCDLCHQFVVIDPVEELLQIQIHHPAIACGDILLRRCHRLMRRASRPKPVAVIGKRPVPLALQHLHHRLLDESIQHRRDAKLSHPSVRLRDFHPPHRLRLIGPAQQLFPDGWPVLFQKLWQLAGRSSRPRQRFLCWP